MARANLQIAVVKYTGTGSAGRVLDAGLTLPPRMALIKRDSSANAEASWRTDLMNNRIAYLGTTASNLTNQITQLDTQIILGSSANVNASATGYYGLFIGARSDANFVSGRYRGAGAGDVKSGHFPFAPEIVIGHVTKNGIESGVMRTANMITTNSVLLSNNNQATTLIQALLADGITVGTSNAVSNASHTYDYVSMRALAGAIAFGSYVGNGAAQAVPVAGMDLTTGGAILIKAGIQTTPTHAVFATSEMVNVDGLQGVRLSSSGYTTEVVTAMGNQSFSVGSHAQVNEDGRTYYWVAFKAGTYSVQPSRAAA